MSVSYRYYKITFNLEQQLSEAARSEVLRDTTSIQLQLKASTPRESLILTDLHPLQLSFFYRTNTKDEASINASIDKISTTLLKEPANKLSPLIEELNPRECFKLLKSVGNFLPSQQEDYADFIEGLQTEVLISDVISTVDQVSIDEIQEIEDLYADILDSYEDEDERPQKEKTVIYVDNLVGVDKFKQELQAIAKYASLNSKLKDQQKKKRVFPLHYILTIQPGMGCTTMLKALATNLHRFGLTGNSNFIEYDENLSFESTKDNAGIFSRKEDGSFNIAADHSVIGLNISQLMGDPLFNLSKLLEIMWDYRGRNIFVLIFKGGSNRLVERQLIEKVMSSINCHHIDFPPYSDTELLVIASRLLKKYGFNFDKEAAEYLLNKIQLEKNSGSFENIRSIQKIIEVARVEKLFRLDNSQEDQVSTLHQDDFTQVMGDNRGAGTADAWQELDSLIGLSSVKQKLKEITAHAKVQRVMNEMGLETDHNCYHMMFTGNPGTGKTTVARILGKMFREIGFLTKGDVVEVGRDNLIGRYVGHTAPLVREKVREALGSVLFVDEAYSLYTGGEDKRDYGHEALSTLIKEMENNRDQLVVILAGYTHDMDNLYEMNDGLRERVPYKIEFPDYDVEELTGIFVTALGGSFTISQEIRESICQLFRVALEHKDEKFGNGRLARNLAERLKVKHSMRIYQENKFSRESIVAITMEDMTALWEDSDVKQLLEKSNEDFKRIGF